MFTHSVISVLHFRLFSSTRVLMIIYLNIVYRSFVAAVVQLDRQTTQGRRQ